MADDSIFGEIPGYGIGSWFESREALKAAGLHRHIQAGISGNSLQGADAIVVSGGYADDVDEGDRLLYTGQGGQDEKKRQVSDQVLSRGNLALVNSEINGLPVRVIKGNSKDGYRYDGLFTVERHFVEPSVDGPLIFRFEMQRCSTVDGASWPSPVSNKSDRQAPTGNQNPALSISTVQRVVRNTAVSQWIKNHYEFTCQICGTQIQTPSGPYAEGAHIRPVGGEHAGKDVIENLLCLCANCHIRFDKGSLYLESEYVVDRVSGESQILLIKPPHQIDQDSADYHRDRFAPLGL